MPPVMRQVGIHARRVSAIKDDLAVALSAALPDQLVMLDHLVEAGETPFAIDLDLTRVGTGTRLHTSIFACRASEGEPVLTHEPAPLILRPNLRLGHTGDRPVAVMARRAFPCLDSAATARHHRDPKRHQVPRRNRLAASEQAGWRVP